MQKLRELKAFALDAANVRYHLISALAVIAGSLVGDYLAQNGLIQLMCNPGYTARKINPLVSESLPFSLEICIFFHNWQVSLATPLSGMWFFAPPLSRSSSTARL